MIVTIYILINFFLNVTVKHKDSVGVLEVKIERTAGSYLSLKYESLWSNRSTTGNNKATLKCTQLSIKQLGIELFLSLLSPSYTIFMRYRLIFFGCFSRSKPIVSCFKPLKFFFCSNWSVYLEPSWVLERRDLIKNAVAWSTVLFCLFIWCLCPQWNF